MSVIREVGYEKITQHEQTLLAYGREVITAIEGVTLISNAPSNAGVLAFTIDGVHAHDAGTILDNSGVAIRTGNHCAQPLMERFGLTATCRASLSMYNTPEDFDALASGINEAIRLLG